VRLFLDANILFSAAYRDASPATLLFDLEAAGRCNLVTSAFALDEAHRNIGLKRPERLPMLETLTGRLQHSPVPDAEAVAVASSYGLPDKDAPILAAAIVAGAEILVTGDRTHFGHLYGKQTGKLRVLTLADTLACLVGTE
jgi:predicted nucleic acid-binding protein